jgi:hypothetical protein
VKLVRHLATSALVALPVVCMAWFSMRIADAEPLLAGITWGSATNISSDSDVDTTGTLVYAYNFGSNTSATLQTVNGVTFSPFVIQDFTNSQTTSNVTVSEDNGYLVSDINVGSINAPFSGLSASYRSLLFSEVYSSNFLTMQVDLGGLTPGNSYRLQWWTNDSAMTDYAPGANFFLFDSVIGGGSAGSVTLATNTSRAVGGLGQYVIGTFTANASTESFTLVGTGTSTYNFPLLNALQLRTVAVPEIDPAGVGSVLALVTGGLGLLERRRRRA